MDINTIPLNQLALTFIPVALVLVILWRWQLGVAKASYALARMLGQLLAIGFALVFLFESESWLLVSVVLLGMLLVSSWISLNTVKGNFIQLYPVALLSIVIGGLSVLLLIVFAVLQAKPWYQPNVIIPLAGMVLANSMTSVSIAAERFKSELQRVDASYIGARNSAFQAAMIPVINSLLAVGLVALPGMMTGQILSGVSPFIAARYQIMIMAMMFGSAGLSVAVFLTLAKNRFSS